MLGPDMPLRVAGLCCMALSYGRMLYRLPAGTADVVNVALVVGFDASILYFMGFKSLMYLLIGVVLGGGLHPMAGHLIAEHYMFLKVSQHHCLCCIQYIYELILLRLCMARDALVLLYCAGGEMLLLHAIHREAAGFAQGFCSVLDNVQCTERLCISAA